jgi:hypothetical protein
MRVSLRYATACSGVVEHDQPVARPPQPRHRRVDVDVDVDVGPTRRRRSDVPAQRRQLLGDQRSLLAATGVDQFLPHPVQQLVAPGEPPLRRFRRGTPPGREVHP